MDVGEVDLLVGISSHQNEKTAGHALQAVERMFQRHFTRQRAVIVDACAESKEGDEPAPSGLSNVAGDNRSLSEQNALRTIQQVKLKFTAPPSSGVAVRTILAAADLLRARACAVVSPRTAGLSPDWIPNLLTPIYRDKFDFVAPLYIRHKFQGLLARNLLYPMSQAIFGCGIRELYSEEWGFSSRLGAACLSQDIWDEEPIRARPEAWMGISAMSADFQCCQSFLGQKLQATSGSGTDIVEIFRQAVSSLFWCIESCQAEWLIGERSETVRTFGLEHALTDEPTNINRGRIFEMFQSGVRELEPILGTILDPETHAEIKNIVSLPEARFRFGTKLWVRTVYDFAASYHHVVMTRDHLVQALTPLYRGMTFSFLAEHSQSSPDEMEAASQELCSEFQHQKPYLKEKWKAKLEVES